MLKNRKDPDPVTNFNGSARIGTLRKIEKCEKTGPPGCEQDVVQAPQPLQIRFIHIRASSKQMMPRDFLRIFIRYLYYLEIRQKLLGVMIENVSQTDIRSPVKYNIFLTKTQQNCDKF